MAASFCSQAKPIIFDDAEQVKATPAPIRAQILKHDKLGQALHCSGW